MKKLLLFLLSCGLFAQTIPVSVNGVPVNITPVPLTHSIPLPTASANNGVSYVARNGASATDCTSGGGAFIVSCYSNGTIWAATAGGATGPQGPTGPTGPTGATGPTGPAGPGITVNQSVRQIAFHFDGQGNALAGTLVGCALKPVSGTIVGWYMSAIPAGSGILGVRSVAENSFNGTASYSSYTDVVNGGTPPTITSAYTNSSSSLTNWITAVSANYYWCIQLSSPSTAVTIDAGVVLNTN